MRITAEMFTCLWASVKEIKKLLEQTGKTSSYGRPLSAKSFGINGPIEINIHMLPEYKSNTQHCQRCFFIYIRFKQFKVNLQLIFTSLCFLLSILCQFSDKMTFLRHTWKIEVPFFSEFISKGVPMTNFSYCKYDFFFKFNLPHSHRDLNILYVFNLSFYILNRIENIFLFSFNYRETVMTIYIMVQIN